MVISLIVGIKDGVSVIPKNENKYSLLSFKRRLLFDYEVLVKEFYFVAISVYHLAIYFLQNNYLRTPKPLKDLKNKKIVVFIHGLGGGSFNFHYLAKKLSQADFKNLYAIDYSRKKDDQVPIEELGKFINEIAKKSLKNNEKLDVTLIGHSLGGALALKYFYNNKNKNVNISKIITLAGLLKFTENKFSWISKDMKSDIDQNYQNYQKKGLCNTSLYTIRGDKDNIVSKESTHIQNDSSKEFSYPDFGHGDVLVGRNVANKVVEILKN
jgi:surfactin synthase thioesterase subunit